jgi:hypothetical protein
MLAIILAISLFSVSHDTIQVKATSNINYRIFTNDCNLYFQCKTNKNWTVPITIDKGNISEYAMTVTSGDYIHIVWCKDGRVYYKTNQLPITRQDSIQWECNIAISPNFTEPASNIFIRTNGDYIYATWQAPLEDSPSQIETWQRARWLGDTPFEWESPQNISLNIMPSFDIPHSSNNRDPIQMKRVCFLQSGLYHEADGKVICCDSDHDGLNEIIFYTGTIYPSNPLRWEVWECRPMNHYELVFADTGTYPLPPGITTGNFLPYDVGDIDGDSLTDLVGSNIDKVINQDIEYNVVTTQESPNYSYYPESLSWSYRYANNMAASQPYYFTNDLDNDGRNEIITATPTSQIATGIWENVANNQNELVWHRIVGAYSFAFSDFDRDSSKEFATADLGSAGRVSVYENTGPDQYELVYQDTTHLPNGSDVFSGNDVDGDGRPEFFVAFSVVPTSTFYLYMWEATGNNTYQRTLIDQKSISVNMTTGRRSKCGDLDGDGIDELVWATPTQLFVYKATGNNQFQQVWQWNQYHGTNEALIVNVYDMNNDGYNEIVVGGSGKTSIFEVEAVRILRPNGGETFHTDSNELIRWQTFHLPRCDSMSLFYSVDNGRTYNLITSGLSGNDTSYLWTVPNANSDSCKIKIIAYGPGWQYDESDGIFRITSLGMSEIASLPLAMTLGVKVYPNPAKILTAIRYSLPAGGKVLLQLYNISGRLVKTLVDESKKSGNYSLTLNSKTLSSGVYFLSLQTKSKRLIERLVIVK